MHPRRASQPPPFPPVGSDDLFRAILSLDSPEECDAFFGDLCTVQELRVMTERWNIAKMLWSGQPYRVITNVTGASSTTISRVARALTYGRGGYRAACGRSVSGKTNVLPGAA